MIHKAFFDRDLKDVNGVFTLQDEKGHKLFERLPARSGQAGYTKTNWVREKSPIPMSAYLIEPYRLWLSSRGVGTDSKKDGIGEFWPISNMGNTGMIEGAMKGQLRTDIGLHWENDKKGSAGCIVLVNDTPERRAQVMKLFAFLHTLKEPYIELVVL